jgi:hypothetical protein
MGCNLVIGFIYNKLFTKFIVFSSIYGSPFVIMAVYFILWYRGWNIKIFLYLKKKFQDFMFFLIKTKLVG